MSNSIRVLSPGVKAYVVATLARAAWPYVYYWAIPRPAVLLPFPGDLANTIGALLRVPGQSFDQAVFTVGVAVTLAWQLYAIVILGVGAVQLARGEPHRLEASLRPPLGRSIWSLIFSLGVTVFGSGYAVIWVCRQLMNSVAASRFRPFHLTPLWDVVHDTGIWPIVVIGVFLAFGLLQAYRFNLAARVNIATAFGCQLVRDDHPLAQRVHALSDRLGIPRPAVGVMRQFNAFAIGARDNESLVALGIPFVKALKPEEIDAVIGHELGHIVSKDLQQSQLAQGFQLWMASLLGNATSKVTDYRWRLPLLVIHALFLWISELLLKEQSRSREFHADAVGAALTSPAAMVGVLRTLAGQRHDHLSQEEELYSALMFRGGRGAWLDLLSTHPAPERRIAAIERGSRVRQKLAAMNG